MLEAVIAVVQELDLNDQEKEYATGFFRGISERTSSLFKKEKTQEKTGGEISPVN